MTLRSLIEKLNAASKTVQRQDLQEDLQAMAEAGIVVPSDFERGEIKVDNLNYSSKDPAPLYHLLIYAPPERSLADTQAFMNEFYTRGKHLSFGKGVVKVKQKVFWTPEDFQQEKKLTDFFLGEVEVNACTHEVDPTKVRIGMSSKRHILYAKTKANFLTIQANGNYRNQFGQIGELMRPQIATLHVPKEDAQRLLKRVGEEGDKKLLGQLQKALTPKKKTAMYLSLGGGIDFGDEEVVKVSVLTAHLPKYERWIGRPLLQEDSRERTHVIELTRVYGPIDLIRGKRLADLQTIARIAQDAELGILYDHPVMTPKDAKEMLEKEIKIAVDSYKETHYFGMNTHLVRGPIVEQLAMDHFGNEVVKPSEELSEADYVAFLQQRGYTPETFDREPDYIAKERHLLAFFLQSYAADPKNSVEAFRKNYVNYRPKTEITGRPARVDGSQIQKIRLPSRAQLLDFEITEHMENATPYSNDAAVSRTLPSSDSIHFWCRTSLDAPLMLPLQEYMCEAIGIKFR